MSYKQIDFPKKIICAGDLNRKITIETREITSPTSVDYTQTFTTKSNVWSAIKTKSPGVEIFDGVNVKGTATHFFYIRYISNVTFEDMVEHNNKYYRILQVENLNEDNLFQVLICCERGDNTQEANWQ